jgi:hypothetical protein
MQKKQEEVYYKRFICLNLASYSHFFQSFGYIFLLRCPEKFTRAPEMGHHADRDANLDNVDSSGSLPIHNYQEDESKSPSGLFFGCQRF